MMALVECQVELSGKVVDAYEPKLDRISDEWFVVHKNRILNFKVSLLVPQENTVLAFDITQNLGHREYCELYELFLNSERK